MNNATKIKKDLQAFYQQESMMRDEEAWLQAGNSPRVPESRASHHFIDRKVTTALALAQTPKNAKVLEIGCSFGHMTFLLTQAFKEVIAVDLSRESLELAKKRVEYYGVKNVRFIWADAEDLSPFDDDTFDAVFAFSTLRFCPNPALALREMRRVLKPRSKMVVDFPNKYCPWFGPIKNMLRIKGHIHDNLYAPQEAVDMVVEAGFVNSKCRQILFTSKRTPDSWLPFFRILEKTLEATPLLKKLAAIIMVKGEKDAAG